MTIVDVEHIKIFCEPGCSRTFNGTELDEHRKHLKLVHRKGTILLDSGHHVAYPIIKEKLLMVLAVAYEGILDEPFMPRDVRNLVNPSGKAASFSSWLHGQSTWRRKFFRQVPKGWMLDRVWIEMTLGFRFRTLPGWWANHADGGEE